MTFAEMDFWSRVHREESSARTKVVVLVDIDTKQKRLDYIREEERSLVLELKALWKEVAELTDGATDAAGE